MSEYTKGQYEAFLKKAYDKEYDLRTEIEEHKVEIGRLREKVNRYVVRDDKKEASLKLAVDGLESMTSALHPYREHMDIIRAVYEHGEETLKTLKGKEEEDGKKH